MANVCYCYMTVSGKSVDALRQRIIKQDPTLEQDFTWLLNSPYYGLTQNPQDFEDCEGDLLVNFTCKWSPPVEVLVDFSKSYPDVTFNLRYEEPGMSCFGLIIVSNGEVLKDTPMDEEKYLYTYDEDFRSEVQAIKGGSYKEFLKKLKKMDTLDEAYQYDRFFEFHYLNRLKDKDLPLIINHEWLDDSNQEIFQKRLKGK